MSTKPISTVEAVAKLVTVLTPFESEDRQRAISAAMILLGEKEIVKSSRSEGGSSTSESEEGSEGISSKAIAWMKKNSITRENLDHIFSIEPDLIDVIAAKMPASSRRQQTVQAYILCGLKSFLLNGEVAFSDKDARDLCSKVGCYDMPNHSNYMKAFNNWINGNKDAGWKLTNPGLSEAIKIVKTLAPDAHA